MNSNTGHPSSESPLQRLEAAIAAYNSGDAAKAEAICRDLINQPNANPNAYHLAGVICLRTGRLAEAQDLIGKAISLFNAANFQFSLASVHQAQGNLPGAIEACRKALALEPKNARISNHLAILLLNQRAYAEAEALCRKALELNPDDTAIMMTLAGTLLITARHAECEPLLRRIITMEPQNAAAHETLGILLQNVRRNEEAEPVLRRAIALRPDLAQAHGALGLILNDTERLDEAKSSLRKAIALQPNLAEARRALGNLLEKIGQMDEAVNEFRAIGDWGNLQRVLRKQLAWQTLPEVDKAYLQNSGSAPPCEPLSLIYIPDMTAEIHRAAARKFGILKYGGQLNSPTLKLSPSSGGKLKIGYLSADFHMHATMLLLAGVLEAHNSREMDFHLLSYDQPHEDEYTRRIAAMPFPRHDLRTLTDSAAAQKIAEMGLDILIDLKGYTHEARLGISAFRPASVIISWLGYPGSLGHERLADYIIGDPVVTPVAHAAHFSETLALMPHSYQPNDRYIPLDAPPSRSEAGLPENGFVFCCFNQPLKINPGDFDLWCRLLLATPGSILWLLDPRTDQARDNLRREAGQRGVQPQRILFAPRVLPQQHFARLQLADLALDTFPYNSHTTGSDALRAGVPLVTRIGEQFASRVAASLLTAHGFPELIATDPQGYYDLALSLAHDPQKLATLRRRMEQARPTSPLFDPSRFARDLERLYRAIWEQRETQAGERKPIILEAAPA